MDFSSVFEIGYTDIILLVLLIYVVYKLFFKKADPLPPPPKRIPPLKKQDMTVGQLKVYNGIDNDHICMGILGKIYDVTRGRDFYGPGSAYENLAGHDATRALANMDVKLVKDEYDDTSNLTASELEEVKEWAERLSFKYPVVGRLLKPDEEPIDYGDQLAEI